MASFETIEQEQIIIVNLKSLTRIWFDRIAYISHVLVETSFQPVYHNFFHFDNLKAITLKAIMVHYICVTFTVTDINILLFIR